MYLFLHRIQFNGQSIEGKLTKYKRVLPWQALDVSSLKLHELLRGCHLD